MTEALSLNCMTSKRLLVIAMMKLCADQLVPPAIGLPYVQYGLPDIPEPAFSDDRGLVGSLLAVALVCSVLAREGLSAFTKQLRRVRKS